MHCANLFLLLRQGAGQRTWKRVLVATGLVLTLGATSSWGQVPATNDTSDDTGNTGGGTDALGKVTPGVPNSGSGSHNTAYGVAALGSNTSGTDNTAVGSNALGSNTTSGANTAVGFSALQNNTEGGNNTSIGAFALHNNTAGGNNTGIGALALQSNTEGGNNTGVGLSALLSTTTGSDNTGMGAFALQSNTEGGSNTGVGVFALHNTKGSSNTGVGHSTLFNNTTGNNNIALGEGALHNITTSNNNIAIGNGAGSKLTGGNKNIYLGHKGKASDSTTMRLGQAQTRTFIAGIVGTALSGSMVLIGSNGQLGVPVSSARYKRDIHDLGARSQGVYQLRPVTFRYTQDAQGQRQYGLIAEEVGKVYPELVTRGADGNVESVQYHALTPLLLNEVQHQQQEIVALKAQHARLQAALAQREAEQREQTAALAARLDQLERASHGATVAAR